MLRQLRFSLTCLSLILCTTLAFGRTWSDSTGKFKVEADLIAQNAERVVLKTKKDKLISLDIKQLSEEDQKYLATAEASAERLADADKNHV
ncbi:MAG: SHD1 domain-containing protein [Pirellulales bacterium]